MKNHNVSLSAINDLGNIIAGNYRHPGQNNPGAVIKGLRPQNRTRSVLCLMPAGKFSYPSGKTKSHDIKTYTK